MTTVAAITSAEAVEQFMAAVGAPRFSLSAPTPRSARWGASCYWPDGDILRDTGCYGSADTVAEAIAAMWAEVEKAKRAAKLLTTAAECKAAVIALIQEHDAAPASFRDAVDALPVKP